ncbi:MAG TPA: carboxypeptidase regulatory-like domain-containing protein, partial [Candidatus Angelobacter sp.]|nr:carboxypeptidase regulatory-like domain-containing protein [Candidatus Angelobacter sp.]
MKHFAFLLVIFIACSLSATGQVLTGTVTNGTRNKPAAGDDVILLSLTKGMDEQARTKTNAKGEFSFNLARTPEAMYLVRVHHQDVNYHEPALPGANNVKVTVYDSKTTVPEITLVDQSEVYQAKEGTVQVVELFRLKNNSVPPVTQPTFE